MPDKIIVSAPGPQGPAGAGGGAISDGDKGDVTVSGSGTTWTIDANAITTAKIASLAISTAKLADNTVTFEKFQTIKGPAVIGREENTTGNVTDLTLGTGLSVSGGVISVVLPNVVQDSRELTAGTGITGGGNLSADRSFAVDFATSGTTSNTKAVRADDSRLSDARTPTAHTHDATDSYIGEIATPTARTYTIDLEAATARTISALYFITSAGTVDVTVKNGANTVYTADGLGTTKTSVTSGLTNTSVSAGGSILLTIDAVSSPADLSFAIYYTRTTGAIS